VPFTEPPSPPELLTNIRSHDAPLDEPVEVVNFSVGESKFTPCRLQGVFGRGDQTLSAVHKKLLQFSLTGVSKTCTTSRQEALAPGRSHQPLGIKWTPIPDSSVVASPKER
jgi:hypothetical protein